MNKRTKIVCTIGPASQSKSVLKKMVKAGMNVARLNFSHGSYAEHKKIIANIRSVAKELKQPIAILQDLQGPRIRLGNLPDKGVKVKKGETVVFTTGDGEGKIPVTYNKLHKEVRKGDRILVADALFAFTVTKINDRDIHAIVVNGGILTSHKGMNFPDSDLKISSLSKKDIDDLEFGIKNKVDFVALSFARRAKDVAELAGLIATFEKKHQIKESVRPKIIVKIEKPEAVMNFDDILDVSDGIMIARGDLGIEMPPQDVPVLQKEFIEKCNMVAKPVIVATQMLESMTKNPRATRAEVSDVANAVADHADAVMLSGESAIGKYPVQAVRLMSDVAHEVEKSRFDDLIYQGSVWEMIVEDEAVVSSAAFLSTSINAKAIVVASMSGDTARLIAKYRPELPTIVTTNSARVERQLNLTWGLIPVRVSSSSIEALAKRAIEHLTRHKLVKKGDEIVIVKGNPLTKKRSRNLRSIELMRV